MVEIDGTVLEKVRVLVEACRERCLWFLSAQFLPSNREEALRALTYIERYGDRQAFISARELRLWLSRTSSASSVG